MEPKEHNGHKIALTEDWRFAISGPLVSEEGRGQTVFSTLADAASKIDELVKQRERQDRVKLSIPVWLENGQRGTITGVHGGHLKALGVGDADNVYPAHPHLSELLLERRELRDRERAINATLQKYRVSTSQRYGSRGYDSAVADLQKRIAEAEALANAELPGSTQAERLSA